MTLATVDLDGRPRRAWSFVAVSTRAGWLVFYSDRESGAKGRARHQLRAALVFNWDAHERQARIEGPVTLVSDAEAD